MNTGYLSIYLCLYNFFQQCFVAVSIQIFHLLSIRFILEYFLLDGTVSGISSFLECSLYRIATDFWALILGCTTSLSTFISSNRFFFVWNCYIFVHIKLCHLWTENFTSFWFGSLLILFVVYLLLLVCLVLCWIEAVKRGHPFLVLDGKGKAFGVSQLSMILVVGS